MKRFKNKQNYQRLTNKTSMPKPKVSPSSTSIFIKEIPKPSYTAYETILSLHPAILFSITDRFLLEVTALRLDKSDKLCEIATTTPLKDTEHFLRKFIASVTNLQKALLDRKPSYFLATDMIIFMSGLQIMLAYMSNHKQNNGSVENKSVDLLGPEKENFNKLLTDLQTPSNLSLLNDSQSELFIAYTYFFQRLSNGPHSDIQIESFDKDSDLAKTYQQYIASAEHFFSSYSYKPKKDLKDEVTTLSDTINTYYFGSNYRTTLEVS